MSAVTLAVEAPGTYTVGYIQNLTTPIFELKTMPRLQGSCEDSLVRSRREGPA
jgi:hypothetical protein